MEFNLQYGGSLSLNWRTPDDIAGMFDRFQGQLEDTLPDIIQAVADQFAVMWATHAKNSLKNADGYVKAIDQRQITPNHIVVFNNHPAVWYLELGTAPFDAKRMLESSAHVKTGKDGNRYIRIPFDGKVKDYVAAGVSEKDLSRMSGTRTNGIARDGRQKNIITAFGDRLNTDAGGTKRKFFTVLDAPHGKFPNKTNNPSAGSSGATIHHAATTIDYTWKTSQFKNAVKMTDFQGKTIGMKTFRTISDKSDPNSWINPGIPASHIAEISVQQIKPIMDMAISDALRPIIDDIEKSLRSMGMA